MERCVLLAALLTAGCESPPICVQRGVAATAAGAATAAEEGRPLTDSCCARGLASYPCAPDGRAVGAPTMSKATVAAIGPLARRAAEAIDTLRYDVLAALVHPERGLTLQHRIRLSPRDFPNLEMAREPQDFSWDGSCPVGEAGAPDCPTKPLTHTGFLDQIITRLGPHGRLSTPLTMTSEVAFGRMVVGELCNLCSVEGELARTYPGVPYVAYHRRAAFSDGCSWEGNQAVIFQFDRDDAGRWWLVGLLRAYGG